MKNNFWTVEIAQTVATQPRQLHYSNNLSKIKKKMDVRLKLPYAVLSLRYGGGGYDVCR